MFRKTPSKHHREISFDIDSFILLDVPMFRKKLILLFLSF